mmetsp:Transcript_13458/g.43923  ORF Transcript_13458/g.43923 Transcript_13458/m.43923 type:complete len:223 (-) Transcript_13458:1019-1687(-)
MSSAKSALPSPSSELTPRDASFWRKMVASLAKADCKTAKKAECSRQSSAAALRAASSASTRATKTASAEPRPPVSPPVSAAAEMCLAAAREERSSRGTHSEVPDWRMMARSCSYFSRCARRSLSCLAMASARVCSISRAMRSFSSNDDCCMACSASMSLRIRASASASSPAPPAAWAAASNALSSSISCLSLPTSVICSFFLALSWMALARSAYASVDIVSS